MVTPEIPLDKMPDRPTSTGSMAPRSFVLFALIGCADTVEPTLPHIDADKAPPPPVELATDLCDDSTYAGMTWQTASSPHFVLNYLPNTVAQYHRSAIISRLESAYADIRDKLGISVQPTLTVNLSPNRTAAAAYGFGFGRGWPGYDSYDVIYTGAPDSYEVVRYGNLIAQLLNYYFDSSNRTRVAFLTTGVGEWLDQSKRNLHDAYAQQLLAGVENRVHVAEFEAKDVTGRNTGRAGSFVQFLVERYGVDMFADIYRATAVSWNGSCWSSATYGCISTPEALTAMFDGVLTAKVGESWSTVQPLWQAEVQDALARAPVGMAPTAMTEIANVVRTMDIAVTTGDPILYRSTLEGFYCDYGGESLRRTVSDRAVAAYGSVTSKVLAVYETGVKNFTTAQALVQRTDDRGVSIFATLYFEHFPVGWRVTWGPDWF